MHALRLLRAAGLGIAIDDFGTGFSSLGRLSELPMGLAHAFGMTIVAEGVENHAQLHYLLREGGDELQGYLHSRPLPRRELEAWLLRSGIAVRRASDLRDVRG